MYNALQCTIRPLDKSSPLYQEIHDLFLRKKTVFLPMIQSSPFDSLYRCAESTFRRRAACDDDAECD